MDKRMIEKAAYFAEKAHAGQVRRYTGLPYVSHAISVSSLVGRVTDDVDVVVAAMLHDTVEDTCVTLDDISAEFGDHVAQLVGEVTDVSTLSDGNRAIRKEIDRKHIANASSEGKTIKLADLIDNSSSIINADPGFAAVYMQEKRALLEVLKDGNSDLYDEATRIVDAYFSND